MDEIQRVLVKAGRKDLARDYYRKVIGAKEIPVPKHLLPKGKTYFVLGRNNPSEHQYQVALVTKVKVNDEALKRIDDFYTQYKEEFNPKDLEYADLAWLVKIENGRKIWVTQEEIDHEVKLPK